MSESAPAAAKRAAPRKETAAQKAERNVVSHVTERGQAGSKRKSEQAAARVKANADKVAAMNAEREGSDRSREEVTPNFKGETKAPAKPGTRARKAPAKAPTAVSKPKGTNGKGGGNGKAQVVDASTKEGWLERHAVATEEAKAVEAWKKAGEKGPQPATPNLDAVKADHAAGVKAPTKRGKRATAERAQSTNKRLAEARALKAKGARAKGDIKKLDDQQLEAWIAKELKADPTLTKSQCLMISFRLDKNGVSGKRFSTAFDAVQKRLRKAS